MKYIIPHKIIISFNDNGTFSEGILQYRIKDESGLILEKYHTVSIDSEINIPNMNMLFKKVLLFVNKQENK